MSAFDLLPALLLSLAACAPAAPRPPCADDAAPAPVHAGAPAGLIYEIYVRSFQDSDGDGVGDLEGVRARLDHLAELGVGTIWLMPLFEAYGPAGYDVTDFDQLEAAYGDPDDLARLVDDAHARGMRVIVDLPFNHVHRSHPWFQAAEADASSAMRSWFVYADPQPAEERWWPSAAGGSYYAYFGDEMPDLDWTAPEVRAAMSEVLRRWLDAGADGYRLDAVLMLVEEEGVVEGAPASHALLAELYAQSRAEHPDTFFLAEASAWEVEDSVSWLGSADAPESDAVLDFPRLDAMMAVADGGEVQALVDLVSTQVSLGGAGGMAGFLGSHDLPRLAERVPDADARRALRVVQLLLPGSPVLYYGEELDLADARTGTGQDWAMRAPMPWSAEHGAGFSTGNPWFPPDPTYLEGQNVADQEADPRSPLQLTRWLGCLRAWYGLDEDGDWTPYEPEPGVLAFTRETGSGRLLVVANLQAAASGALSLPVPGPLRDLQRGVALGAQDGILLDALPPWSFRVLGDAIPAPCRRPGL